MEQLIERIETVFGAAWRWRWAHRGRIGLVAGIAIGFFLTWLI